MNKLLLIDGNNLFHRAYHAMPPLTGKDGENSNAVFGFSNMLLKAIDEVGPSYVACAFDTAAPTFRHVEFEKYKAQRPAPPPDLYPQLPKVKKVLEAFGIPYFEKAGYEADDLLATIAFKVMHSHAHLRGVRGHDHAHLGGESGGSATRKFDIVILSGDRDVLQLVDGYIKVQMPGWNLTTTTLFGAKEVEEKFGITPAQMVDYKSLTGDPSDNVPGVAGIGPKTASALLQKYGTVEAIYEHIDEIGGTTKAKLEAGRDLAIHAKGLVKLDTNVNLEPAIGRGKFRIENLEYKPDWERVRGQFEELGFKSIVAKLPGGTSDVSQSPKKSSIDSQLKLV